MKPFKEQIEENLKKLELSFEYDAECDFFEYDLQTKYAVVTTAIFYDEEDMFLMNIGYVPVSVPEEHMTEMLYLINKINNEVNGRCSLSLNEENNWLMAKSLIDVPQEGVNEEVFGHFAYSTSTIFDKYYRELMTVAFQKEPDSPKTETEENDFVKSLLLAQENKTYN